MADPSIRQLLSSGIAYAKQGQVEEALPLFRRVARNHPDNLLAWKCLAYYTGSPREREVAVRRVLKLDPQDEWARKV
ncbi:MAG: tetratricopeptide repeat protein, partial [Chloroflexi bacterium]|nr:tetratricopeptide repeat protein [Chloroflexota bacterium]